MSCCKWATSKVEISVYVEIDTNISIDWFSSALAIAGSFF